MDRALDFYKDVLTFEKVSDVEVTGEAYEQLMGVFGLRMRVARMRLGEERIELMEALTPKGRPIPVDSHSNDLWFQHVAIIVSDMGRAFDWLRAHDITYASPAPQRLPDWNPNAGGIEAFYFKDPDGNHLEILHFPEGKGDPKWHGATDRLFLGIDHTAIVVEDTDASLAFYRDRLGLRIAGKSENWGPEQERLNNVFGAHLRITALRAPNGPGIEFLEYLTPRDGRPFPADTRASDLWHWQINLSTVDVDPAAEALRDGRARFASSGVTRLPDHSLGFATGLMARDPDGHALLLIEQPRQTRCVQPLIPATATTVPALCRGLVPIAR
jgi:catechol 2,3-dioxygenase-like lactoylglutathione lyase family enzyme